METMRCLLQLCHDNKEAMLHESQLCRSDGGDMKESRYDIPAPGGSEGWTGDLAYGHEGEALVQGFIASLCNGSYEVKTDRWRNGRMVVETMQNPRRSGWKKSGLMVTEADWWTYVYALEGAMVIISVPRLKRFIDSLPKARLRTFVAHSENPTRGYLLEPEEVMDMMYNVLYDD